MDETPPTILIIDADTASRNYLAVVLRKAGFTTLLAGSGKEGLIQAWQNLPTLIIIDPALPDTPVLDLIARLRQDHRTASAPCIALSSQEKSDEMTSLLSAGFNEYLVKSSEAVSKILDMIPRLLTRTAKVKKGGALIVFLSAKGGTGTSSLCANIAMCTGRSFTQASVAMLDLVLPIGSIANIVGYTDRFNLITVAGMNSEITTSMYLKENLPRQLPWDFRLLAGSPDPESANQLQITRIPELIAAIQDVYDAAFIDLGRSLSRISIPILQRADVIVLVVGSDLSTVTLTKTVWEYLKTQGVDMQRVYLILNRAVGLEGMTKAEIDHELGAEIGITIPYLGGNMTLANNRHEPFIEKFPNDSAALLLQQASRAIVDMAQRTRAR